MPSEKWNGGTKVMRMFWGPAGDISVAASLFEDKIEVCGPVANLDKEGQDRLGTLLFAMGNQARTWRGEMLSTAKKIPVDWGEMKDTI